MIFNRFFLHFLSGNNDFYVWLNYCEMVDKREIDAENITEELESMGKRDRASH